MASWTVFCSFTAKLRQTSRKRVASTSPTSHNVYYTFRLLTFRLLTFGFSHFVHFPFRPPHISSTSHFVYSNFAYFHYVYSRFVYSHFVFFRFVSSTVIVEEVRLERNGKKTIWDDIIGNPKVRRFLDAAQICKGWQM